MHYSITFLHINVTMMLCVYTDRTSWLALQERFRKKPSSGTIHDVYDGKLYKKHKSFLSQPANVSFTINTDGVAVFRSSNSSLWPVWVQINEFPKTKRLIELKFKVDTDCVSMTGKKCFLFFIYQVSEEKCVISGIVFQ